MIPPLPHPRLPAGLPRRIRPGFDPTPHEASAACSGAHCFACGIDEPTPERPYLVCGECGHYYPSARALRRDYRREAWRFIRVEWSRVGTRQALPAVAEQITDMFSDLLSDAPIDGSPWPPPPGTLRWRWDLIRHAAALPFVRASKITFCQRCIHDF